MSDKYSEESIQQSTNTIKSQYSKVLIHTSQVRESHFFAQDKCHRVEPVAATRVTRNGGWLIDHKNVVIVFYDLKWGGCHWIFMPENLPQPKILMDCFIH